MHRPITFVSDLNPDSLPASIELYWFSMCGDDSTRPVVVLVKHIIKWRKVFL